MHVAMLRNERWDISEHLSRLADLLNFLCGQLDFDRAQILLQALQVHKHLCK